MTDWQVGMKAVCIEVADTDLTLNRVYTVRGMRLFEAGEVAIDPRSGVSWLLGCDVLTLQLCETALRHGYPAEYFRPLVERKSDISIFTAMLNTAKEPERELAR